MARPATGAARRQPCADQRVSRPRARERGVVIGSLPTGARNAITDVAGVRVGHATIIADEGERAVRTGVTVILPRPGDMAQTPLFAAPHRLNGNGELTGLEWVRESGMLSSPIALTNTHSVGIVRDALVAEAVRADPDSLWRLPVVGETWDGTLNDTNGQHITAQHVDAALAAASDSEVAEGNVGGGTGMICHDFKGGIGTSSRRLPAESGGYTVGVLVQANHGRRERLQINGAPVGREIPYGEVPEPDWDGRGSPEPGSGSIIAIAATDAPLLPWQCARLAQRAGLGIARTGGVGEHYSGDIFLAFATGNRDLPAVGYAPDPPLAVGIQMLLDAHITALYDAVIEATEESIVNALFTAETMTGRRSASVHELPHDRTLAILERYGRLRSG